VPTEAENIKAVAEPGRYDVIVGSEAEAKRIVKGAMPDGVEVSPAIAGTPYPVPPRGVKKWFQRHPPEPSVGHDLPHIKYQDWTGGKKGSGGSWGRIFFPEDELGSESGGMTCQ
jgi:hypothetical protein